MFKEKREKEKAWSEFEFCLATDEEKWRFKDVFMEKKGLAWKWTFESIFNEHKTTKVKCEFRYGTIFGYLEKGPAQR